MLYNLNLYSAVNQLYFNKTGRKKVSDNSKKKDTNFLKKLINYNYNKLYKKKL